MNSHKRNGGRIVFKCEDSLFQPLKDGTRTFDMRRWDMSDDRIYRLAWGRRVGLSGWRPEEREVTFVNKATGEELTLPFWGLEFAEWAPGWCFLRVQDLHPDARHPSK